jgi:hypothetical protein
MAYIEKIAYHLGRRDEVPNQELAEQLAKEKNKAGIEEIASYLDDENSSIQSDCIKVLYQIGYVAPELIAAYAGKFIEMLDSKNNRMVWGGMIALATIAELVPEEIWPHRTKILEKIETGTVITNVWGVKVLIGLGKAGDKYYDALISDLLRLQNECRDVDFAKRAEEMEPAIKAAEREAYRKILEMRKLDLSKSAQARLGKVIRKLENYE